MSTQDQHHSLSVTEAMYARSGLDELPPISPRTSESAATAPVKEFSETLYERSGLNEMPPMHSAAAKQFANDAADSLKSGAQKMSDGVKSSAESIKATLSEPLESERAVHDAPSPISSAFASVKEKMAGVGAAIKDSIVPSRPSMSDADEADRTLREEERARREVIDATLSTGSVTSAQHSAQTHSHLIHTAKPQDGFPQPGSAEEKARDQVLKDVVGAHYQAVFDNREVVKEGMLGSTPVEVQQLAAASAAARAKSDENDARAKAHLAHADLTRKLSKA